MVICRRLQGTAPGGRDFQGALALLRQASALGHVVATYKLGHMTLNGIGAYVRGACAPLSCAQKRPRGHASKRHGARALLSAH